MANRWLTFRRGLDILCELRIPRWLGMSKNRETTLLGFCDASCKAYGAVIYAKTTDGDNNIQIRLLTARTKVAPLKNVTIPRLELRAAQLLAITLDNVRTALQLENSQCHLWSDSAIVLCWLKKSPSTLKQFAANRVQEIQKYTSSQCWNHISTQQNPADCASRGLPADKLLQHSLWWQGPEFIHKHLENIQEEIKLNQEDIFLLQQEEKITTLLTRQESTLSITTTSNG